MLQLSSVELEMELRQALESNPLLELSEIDGEIDIVNVFRRAADIPAHLPDILSARPRAVWMQLGIRHEEVADELADAGEALPENVQVLIERVAHLLRLLPFDRLFRLPDLALQPRLDVAVIARREQVMRA